MVRLRSSVGNYRHIRYNCEKSRGDHSLLSFRGSRSNSGVVDWSNIQGKATLTVSHGDTAHLPGQRVHPDPGRLPGAHRTVGDLRPHRLRHLRPRGPGLDLRAASDGYSTTETRIGELSYSYASPSTGSCSAAHPQAPTPRCAGRPPTRPSRPTTLPSSRRSSPYESGTKPRALQSMVTLQSGSLLAGSMVHPPGSAPSRGRRCSHGVPAACPYGGHASVIEGDQRVVGQAPDLRFHAKSLEGLGPRSSLKPNGRPNAEQHQGTENE